MFRVKYDILEALDKIESRVGAEPFRWSEVKDIVAPPHLIYMGGEGLLSSSYPPDTRRTKEWQITVEGFRILNGFRNGPYAPRVYRK